MYILNLGVKGSEHCSAAQKGKSNRNDDQKIDFGAVNHLNSSDF